MLKWEEVEDAALVGHSYGGFVVNSVAGTSGHERIRRGRARSAGAPGPRSPARAAAPRPSGRPRRAIRRRPPAEEPPSVTQPNGHGAGQHDGRVEDDVQRARTRRDAEPLLDLFRDGLQLGPSPSCGQRTRHRGGSSCRVAVTSSRDMPGGQIARTGAAAVLRRVRARVPRVHEPSRRRRCEAGARMDVARIA